MSVQVWPTMAKQRRNRERATELMSTLDELVPAVYPYRAFTSTNGEESSLRKRSRNKTLEDVISCVSRAMAHAEREVKSHSPRHDSPLHYGAMHACPRALVSQGPPPPVPKSRIMGGGAQGPPPPRDRIPRTMRSPASSSTPTSTWRTSSRPSTPASASRYSKTMERCRPITLFCNTLRDLPSVLFTHRTQSPRPPWC